MLKELDITAEDQENRKYQMEDFLLSNKERMQIFKVLSENKTLNFNSIVKLTGIRSNKLSYQLNLMKEKNFVITEEGNYLLSIEAQRLIPYFSQIFKKEVGVLPVVLGIVRNGEKILLIKRRKMPYKGCWGLPGGKQISGETIPETIEREVREESTITAQFQRCNGIVYERLKEDDRFKHSFLLIITTLHTNSLNAMEQQEGEVQWFEFNDVVNDKVGKIIPSDLLILKKYTDRESEIEHLIVEEKGENLLLG